MREFFPRVLGNGQTKERLGAGISGGTLPHAFLIIGPFGSGKSTLAREISAALNCERRSDSGVPLPCGECNCCKRIYDGNFPDVKILSKLKDKATLGVDLIKDFREDMFLSSTESDYKIYIIDDGECMTAEAQNALLKVLEEPPSGVVIMILATEGDKILTTIKSRAQHIAMSRFEPAELERQLLSISSDARELKRDDPERFQSIIVSSDGILGEAMRLSNKKLAAECAEEHREISEILRAFTAPKSFKEVYRASALLPTKRNELILAFEEITKALRDLIAVKQSKNVNLLFFTSREEAESVGADTTVRALLRVYDEIQGAHGLCVRNANIPNLIAGLTARIKML